MQKITAEIMQQLKGISPKKLNKLLKHSKKPFKVVSKENGVVVIIQDGFIVNIENNKENKTSDLIIAINKWIKAYNDEKKKRTYEIIKELFKNNEQIKNTLNELLEI